ncbi:drebrin-like protein B isoform X2 [Pseudonaja textilis]|uniref:drebrin-like protein B isoform X2 n=1 Tax=Pseudonaja textilis TaxID=8673 RepID=UPI000EA8BA8F|nr:drebrin-like protein B isoform X2 [Pseudonaja textilis]
MGSSALDLDKHRLALLAAKSDVVNGRAAASWALFAYEKANELKLLDSGGGGPDELAKRFQSGCIMYGLCRLLEPTTGVPRIVLIHWVGEEVLDSRREVCAGHLPAIRAFFKEAHLVLKASRVEDVNQEKLTCRLSLVAPPEQPPQEAAFPKKDLSGDPEEVVGTNYQKTNAVLEILHTKRSSFWAQAEKEEEERRQEEKRRAQEERRHWERLRMEDERREAAERERRVQEKERLIEEHRKQQAQREAEEHRWEEARRREQARALAGTSPRSWASEAAPEAGPGVEQPPRRSFFQTRAQLGSSSAVGDPGPGLPRRPFLRYQRSLTESAYIFRRPAEPDLPGSFEASAAPPVGPKPGTAPKPASPPASTPPAHRQAESGPPPCTLLCPPSPALACALNGTPAEPPHLAPSPESEHFPGQESPLLTPLGSCSPPAEEIQAPSHAPEGPMSPGPAQPSNGRAVDWEELPSPTANSPPRAGLGETALERGASPGPAPGQAGSVLSSGHRGSEGERGRAEQGNRPQDGRTA